MGMSLGEPHLVDVSVLMYNTMWAWVCGNHIYDLVDVNDSNSMGMCPHLVDVNEGWGPDVIE